MNILLLIFLTSFQQGNFDDYSELEAQIELDEKVTFVWQDRGTTFITTESGEKYWIRHSRNYEFRNAWLNDFIEVNDQIHKQANSDTLLISRNSNVYTFVIGEFLNEHLSTSTKINLEVAFRLVLLLGLFIIMFGSYTRTTVLLTWNGYKIERSPVNNIKNAIALISSGHAKKGIFIFLLALFFTSTLLFGLTIMSFWIESQ